MHAKGKRDCATKVVCERMLKKNPKLIENLKEIEEFTRFYEKMGTRFKMGIIRIPVVVHVVYNPSNPSGNISVAQIQSQLDVLNEDYRMLNPDISTVPSEFQPFTGDARIEFHLAVRDPDCNSTTGITRTETTVTAFDPSVSDGVKFDSQGGKSGWPPDKYLNMWVCKLVSPYLGYGTPPGYSPAYDGLVMDYRYFGTIGTATSPFDLGRTSTHEVGHYFNLIHIWGDDEDEADVCSESDEVDDTPEQGIMNFGCPTFPKTSECGSPDGDMFMNYMDYVDDSCMVMFTEGQVLRMTAALFGPRASLLGSDALSPPTPSHDLWIQDYPDDIGDEPNTISEKMYRSQDIWIRNSNDGLINQEHENPVYGSTNYVYVRVKNRGCDSSDSGTVKLYWAKASTALSWPAPWDGSITSPALMGDPIGSQSVTVSSGDYEILEFAWSPPNPADYSSFGADKSHFCLLARIETSSSSPYGMTTPETSGLNSNVRNNNNIAWKNVTIVDASLGSEIGYVTVGNMDKETFLSKLVFDETIDKWMTIFRWGYVDVDLGSKLYDLWKKGGMKANGIKVVGGNTIRILKSEAWIANILMEPGALYTIAIKFAPFDTPPIENNFFKFNVTQSKIFGRGYQLLGGETFVIKSLKK
ncbi:MAG: zinc metalloprotease [bacterium]|nr:zinc metalloprotease [bacterium]